MKTYNLTSFIGVFLENRDFYKNRVQYNIYKLVKDMCKINHKQVLSTISASQQSVRQCLTWWKGNIKISTYHYCGHSNPHTQANRFKPQPLGQFFQIFHKNMHVRMCVSVYLLSCYENWSIVRKKIPARLIYVIHCLKKRWKYNMSAVCLIAYWFYYVPSKLGVRLCIT